MVPLSPELGLYSATDMFRNPGHCCRTLLPGRTCGGIHSHDSKGKKMVGRITRFLIFPFCR